MKINKWFQKITKPATSQEIDQGFEQLDLPLRPSSWGSSNTDHDTGFTSNFYQLTEEGKQAIMIIFNQVKNDINENSGSNECVFSRINLFHAHVLANETRIMFLFHAFEYPMESTGLDYENEIYLKALGIPNLQLQGFKSSSKGFRYRNYLAVFNNTQIGELDGESFEAFNLDCLEWNNENVFSGGKWSKPVSPSGWAVDQDRLLEEYNFLYPGENEKLFLHPCINFFREQNKDLIFFKK